MNINMKLYKAIGNPPSHPATGQPGNRAARQQDLGLKKPPPPWAQLGVPTTWATSSGGGGCSRNRSSGGSVVTAATTTALTWPPLPPPCVVGLSTYSKLYSTWPVQSLLHSGYTLLLLHLGAGGSYHVLSGHPPYTLYSKVSLMC